MDSNILAAFIGLAGGLLGVTVAAYIQFWQLKRTDQLHHTMDLYNMLDDSELLESRMHAYDLLEPNRNAANPKSLSQLESDLSTPEWLHIARTRHFFERLCFLTEAGYVDRTLARRFFSNLILSWYEIYFEQLDALDQKAGKVSGPGREGFRYRAEDVRRLFA